jgi:pimeloyl-ACP methyl ester carboxylesterase
MNKKNAPHSGHRPSVVLVHGAFVDGSGWKDVYKILTREGYPVTIVQNRTVSLADDVATTRRAIAAQSGPVILVGHSYGGVVVSEAGNDPKVAALVYIAGFAPDTGESIETLSANPPPGSTAPPFTPPEDGFIFLDQSKFVAAFAADVNAEEAAFMAASQVPCGVGAVSGAVTTPAWRTKPSWYLVTMTDKMIPPAAQQSMAKRAGATVTETEGNHAIFVSKPDVVASVIERAAAATSAHSR